MRPASVTRSANPIVSNFCCWRKEEGSGKGSKNDFFGVGGVFDVVVRISKPKVVLGRLANFKKRLAHLG